MDASISGQHNFWPTQAFYCTTGGHTAVCFATENPGCWFVVDIAHQAGSQRAHPVEIAPDLTAALEIAQRLVRSAGVS